MPGLHEIASQAALEATKEELHLSPRELHIDLYRWLLELRKEQRLYYLSPEMVSEDIWPLLRRNEELLDFVMRASIGFRLRMSGDSQGDHFVAYTQKLGHAIGDMTGRGRGNPTQVTDSTFSEKILPSAKLTNLLQQESWLAYLVALERCLTQLLPKNLLEDITPTSAGRSPNAKNST